MPLTAPSLKGLFIKTYGCQMNVYDSARMVDVLKPLGYALSATPEDADLIILNTCHIREKAAEKLFSDLGRLRSVKAQRIQGGRACLLAVAGCVAQAQGEEIINRAPAVDLVFGPQMYHELPHMLAQIARAGAGLPAGQRATKPGQGAVFLDFTPIAKFDNLPLPSHGTRPSAFLSIQEGCDKFCTFCVVPYTRGAEYSRPARDILKEAAHLVESGAKEIVLLGQNVSAYHGQAPDGKKHWGLGTLLEALAELDGLLRLRYTTSHPRDIDEALIQAHRNIPKCMPFLHLPVQSGSDQILQAMNRKHTAAFYHQIIEKLRTACPAIAFSSDFIVGFPGETEADFQATLDLVKTVCYAQAYSFKYSPRPGTPGALKTPQIPEAVKDERLSRLQELLTQQQQVFNQGFVGQTVSVLVEQYKNNQWQGRTPHMQSISFAADQQDICGQIAHVDVTSSFAYGLKGQLTRPLNLNNPHG